MPAKNGKAKGGKDSRRIVATIGRKPSRAKPLVRIASEKRPPGTQGRPTDLEVLERLDAVDECVRAGMSRPDILHEMRERFGISDRAIDGYIQRTRAKWQRDLALQQGSARDAMVQRVDALIDRCERAGQYGAAVSGLRLFANVQGLLSETRNINMNPGGAPAADSLEAVGLVGVVAELSLAMRSATRALRMGMAAPQSAKERAEFMGALRELRDASDAALRDLRVRPAKHADA